jgi:hypothetical protein
MRVSKVCTILRLAKGSINAVAYIQDFPLTLDAVNPHDTHYFMICKDSLKSETLNNIVNNLGILALSCDLMRVAE